MNQLSPTMSNDSKKRHQLNRQIADRLKDVRDKKLTKSIVSRAQSVDIGVVEKVAAVLHSPKKWDIIEKATTFPVGKNPETQKFVICFDYFNWRTCNLEQFNPAKGKKLLEILEQVATCTINRFPELRLIRDSISRTPVYESLFATVSPEVTKINETELCEGRLFFFITEPRFNIVSVETKHRNIDR